MGAVRMGEGGGVSGGGGVSPPLCDIPSRPPPPPRGMSPKGVGKNKTWWAVTPSAHGTVVLLEWAVVLL